MKVAYLDCFSGVAGDMLLGAFIDAGAPLEAVQAALVSVGLDAGVISVTETQRAGLRAGRVDLRTNDDRSRRYADIKGLLQNSELSPTVKQNALKTFDLLAHAEARVHGVEPNNVHFHEVGSLDALIDIVGTCAAVHALGIDRVFVSAIATGTGEVKTEHGLLPLPVPAVVELLRDTAATLVTRGSEELVTPTGAALLAALADEFGPVPAMKVSSIGHGAGTADRPIANILRVLVGDTRAPGWAHGTSVLLETNVDDMTPELVAHAAEELIAAGAQDAWITPIVMKKGRPAFAISALATPERESDLTAVFFKETTTLGIRTLPVDRSVLAREWIRVEVRGLPIRVKLGRANGRVITISPEHDDAVEASRATGLALRLIYDEAARAVEPLVHQETGENG
ncbi:MAG: nickel pincer cofactor biosynthesis protein LarC [Actinomycetota bacterium]|nr:nickel pincer cofactor biosynthesis protein LarC [Actinomycetota bacterium]